MPLTKEEKIRDIKIEDVKVRFLNKSFDEWEKWVGDDICMEFYYDTALYYMAEALLEVEELYDRQSFEKDNKAKVSVEQILDSAINKVKVDSNPLNIEKLKGIMNPDLINKLLIKPKDKDWLLELYETNWDYKAMASQNNISESGVRKRFDRISKKVSEAT